MWNLRNKTNEQRKTETNKQTNKKNPQNQTLNYREQMVTRGEVDVGDE